MTKSKLKPNKINLTKHRMYAKVEQAKKLNKINRAQCEQAKVEQDTIISIIKRELSKGTFDNTCTVDERMKLRKFTFKIKGFIFYREIPLKKVECS